MTGYDFDADPGVPAGEGRSIEQTAADYRETQRPHDTETEWYKYGLRATAIRQYGRREWRCRIECDTWSTNDPRVSFAKRVPDADVDVLSSWSATATGRLGAPQNLRRWMHLCDVFQAALDALVAEIASEGVDFQQAAVYDHRTGDPHPIFEVPHRPERESIDLDDGGETA